MPLEVIQAFHAPDEGDAAISITLGTGKSHVSSMKIKLAYYGTDITKHNSFSSVSDTAAWRRGVAAPGEQGAYL